MALDPTIPRWPKLLSPRDFTDPQLINATMDSPTPIIGAGQAVLSDAGVWQIMLIGIPVYSKAGGVDLLAVWRSLWTSRLQQALPVYMPFRDWARGPVARGGLAVDPALVPYSDTSVFSDTTEFASGYEDVKVVGAVVQYGTVLSVDVDPTIGAGATPQGGDFVSIDERAYLIDAAFPDDTVANRWTWRIMPPLRVPVVSGAIVEIRDPICRMVVPVDDRKKIQLTRDLGALSRATLTFVEERW